VFAQLVQVEAVAVVALPRLTELAVTLLLSALVYWWQVEAVADQAVQYLQVA
jgi:hypothetical protein